MTRKFLTTSLLSLIVCVAALGQEQHEHHDQQARSKKPPPKPKTATPSGHDQMDMPGMKMPATPGAQPLAPTDSHQGHEAKPGRPAQGTEDMQGMQGMEQKSLDELIRNVPSNLVPRVGASQKNSVAPTMKLEDLQKIALRKNPTLSQAEAEVRSMQGRALQAGLWPNPTVGYTGDEIRGGDSRGGKQGFFVQQNIVLGRKLALSRQVAQQDVRLAEIEKEEQQIRVTNAVQLAYYQTLASQEMLELDKSFVKIAQQTLKTAQQLMNIGARDRSEVLQSEIALRKAELTLKRQQNQHRQVWRALAAVVGEPDLAMVSLEGDLTRVPATASPEELTRKLVMESPASRIAQTSVARSEASLARARRESVPDLQFRGGLEQNRELMPSGSPIGLQGFAEVGISIPIFNRNQGNIQSSRAELERAQQELNRVQLTLTERAASVVRAYEDARDAAEQYQKEIIPRAQEIYVMQLKAWGQMGVSYPAVLQSQNELFQVETEYVQALRDLQITNVSLNGFMLMDGLEPPARPSDVDTPIRELNMPTSRGGMER